MCTLDLFTLDRFKSKDWRRSPMTMTKVCLLSGVLLLGACASEAGRKPPTEDVGQTAAALSLIPRGATCADLGLGNQQLTLATPVNGTYSLDGTNSFTFLYDDDGTDSVFKFFNSTIRITGVMASNGSRTLVWEMPEGQTGYGSLHGPPDPTTGFISTPEEVSFCYDYELRVQPSPFALHTQRPSWSITKSGRSDFVTLAEGQEEPVDYEVRVNPGAVSPAGQLVTGPLFVRNGSPHTITVGSLSTMVGDIAATITCPTAPPFTMAPFTLLECSFRAEVPDTTDRNVVGSGSSTHGLKVSTQEVVASFASHTTGTTTIDRCIAVRDDAAPFNDHFLGTACVEEGPKTFNFSTDIGPFACGNFAATSTASYQGLDSGATGNASWTINGEVACNPGCTLGAGYWRRHSDASPKRYNPIWNLIGPEGENTPFFTSGSSHYEAISRPIEGNAYWTLARAYVAMKLNNLNGARFAAANQTHFNNATNLLTSYAPAQVAGNNTLRKTFVKAAADLKDFNSGRTGPGRCTSKPDLED